MITTRNEEWDRQFRLLRQHAMSVPDTVRHGSKEVIFESYPTIGFNYRMTDIQAAVGREQLKRLPQIIRERRVCAERYADLLSSVQHVALPPEPEWARTNWQSYCVRVEPIAPQRAVMQSMLDAQISTRRGVMCSHREPAYAESHSGDHLPESERAQDECILLPLFGAITLEDQKQVAAALRQAISALASTADAADAAEPKSSMPVHETAGSGVAGT
jgi:dTDP-4-amino-4,6-dideoxygalactose transaminase